MTKYENDLLSRVDALDKSTWGVKSVSLIKNLKFKHFPDAPYTVSRTCDKYINLLDVYIAMEDPGEYEFAKRAFGSYKTWRKLIKSPAMSDYVAQMRRELEIKLKSKALRGIIDLADDVDTKETTKITAYKYLISNAWAEDLPKTKKKTSKDAVKSDVRRSIADDVERLGLKVISNDR